jgi:hypothetical protein
MHQLDKVGTFSAAGWNSALDAIRELPGRTIGLNCLGDMWARKETLVLGRHRRAAERTGRLVTTGEVHSRLPYPKQGKSPTSDNWFLFHSGQHSLQIFSNDIL